MTEEKTNCGIYQIRNLVNDKVYNGQTTDLTKRENKWTDDLMKRNTRYNQHLERSYHKYGSNNFTFNILIENLLPEQLDEYEIAMIKFTKSHEPEIGYNKTMGGEGGVPNEETRNKMSEAMTKVWKDTEYKLKRSGKNHHGYGKKCPIIEKISGENNYLKKLTPEEYDEEMKKRSEVRKGENNYINKMSPKERKKILKKRSDSYSPENNPTVKLTVRKVLTIKILLRNLTYRGAINKIAAIYGVHPSTIRAIKNGQSWSKVKVRGWDY